MSDIVPNTFVILFYFFSVNPLLKCASVKKVDTFVEKSSTG